MRQLQNGQVPSKPGALGEGRRAVCRSRSCDRRDLEAVANLATIADVFPVPGGLMPGYQPTQSPLVRLTEAVPGRNDGRAVTNPRMRACSTVVLDPSPTLRVHIPLRPAVP
jgi:hypothetical protein